MTTSGAAASRPTKGILTANMSSDPGQGSHGGQQISQRLLVSADPTLDIGEKQLLHDAGSRALGPFVLALMVLTLVITTLVTTTLVTTTLVIRSLRGPLVPRFLSAMLCNGVIRIVGVFATGFAVRNFVQSGQHALQMNPKSLILVKQTIDERIYVVVFFLACRCSAHRS